MEETKYFIVNLNTGQYYSGWEGETVLYSEDKVDGKEIPESELGKELFKLRLKGELVEYRS